MPKRPKPPEAKKDTQPEPAPWPGIIIRETAPDGALPVLTLIARLDEQARLIGFSLNAFNSDRNTEAARAAYALAIKSHLDAQQRNPPRTATCPHED